MVTPDQKQRDPVIYLSIFPQPSAGLAAAPLLEPAQECGLAVRRIPELPRDNTSAMPDGILVWAGIPQILVPAESVHWLAANAAKTRP